jgi:dUTP pyrophosphatase
VSVAQLERVRVQRLREDATLPTRAHDGDAGLDLYSVDDAVIPPAGGRVMLGTGIAVEIPFGWTGLVCPRSGMAMRHGIGKVNSPGVIDSGYRGEVRVSLLNTDPTEPFTVRAGDRVGQLVIVPVFMGAVEEVDELSDAARNADGFGSTGGFGGGD